MKDKPDENAEDVISLSPRQKEILILICDEKTNQEIAEILSISVKTVMTHRHTLKVKIGTTSVVGLVLYAVSVGLVQVKPRSIHLEANNSE